MTCLRNFNSNMSLTFLPLPVATTTTSTPVFPVKYGRLSDHLRSCAFTSHSLHLTSVAPPPVPEEGAQCAPPSIRLVTGRSGAVGEDYVGLGSFPRSDYPGLLGRNRPPPLRPSPPPLPPLSALILSVCTAGALHSSQISSLAAQISADDVCCAHMCDHTSVESPSVPAGSGKAEFYENKCLIKELGCVGLPDWFQYWHLII